MADEEESHTIASLGIVLLIALLILTILIIWAFKVKKWQLLHETGASIFLGVIAGLIIRLAPGDSLEEVVLFNPELFLDLILPPIIFHAGYGLKRSHFFRNFGPILTFALLGTIIATFVTGVLTYVMVLIGLGGDLSFVHCMLFGALISATDPVTVLAIFHELRADVDLYALIFGESVLNDAVAIVLYTTIAGFEDGTTELNAKSIFTALGMFMGVFMGSLCIGVAVALVTAIITKKTSIREFPLLEVTLFILMSYSSFIVAEGVSMSGIVSILFCGIVQAHYTFHNLSDSSKRMSKEFFSVLNFMAENFIFSYIGINLFAYRDHNWKPALIAVSFPIILFARACNIYPLSALLNRCLAGRADKRNDGDRISVIGGDSSGDGSDGGAAGSSSGGGGGGGGGGSSSSRSRSGSGSGKKVVVQRAHQHMMWFSGLRGAIAFALAVKSNSPQMKIVLSMTLVIVIVTVVVFGGATLPMLQWLKIKMNVEDDEDEDEMALMPVNENGDPGSVGSAADERRARALARAEAAVTRRGTDSDLSMADSKLAFWVLNADRRFLTPFFTRAGRAHHGVVFESYDDDTTSLSNVSLRSRSETTLLERSQQLGTMGGLQMMGDDDAVDQHINFSSEELPEPLVGGPGGGRGGGASTA